MGQDLETWWRGGDLLMPVMLAAGLMLYALVGERLWALFGQPASHQATEEEITRGLGLIRMLTGVLPLLGLLGTVSGMVETFSQLGSSSAAGRVTSLSGGVSMALTATQYGLALAIPAIVADLLLRRRAAALLVGIRS